MTGQKPRPRWELPWRVPAPREARAAGRAKALRIVAWALLAAAVLAPAVQFQVGTMRELARAEAFDRRHPDRGPQTRHIAFGGPTPAAALAGGPRRPGGHKGAIGRWRKAIRQFWAGRDIYELPPADAAERSRASPPSTSPAASAAPETGATAVAGTPASSAPAAADRQELVYLHPNCPAAVILLTPFAYMPVWAMAMSFNVLKLAVLATAALMSARLAGHGPQRITDWVLGLGLLWALMPIVGDIQHGNTNTLVLGAIVLHLWLYRRGGDALAGLPLAAAILLKMTPGLLLLYWLWQRNWRLLAGAGVSLAVLGAGLPAAVVGPGRAAELSRTWARNLIAPGLVRGAWYPEHINQSLAGVAARYFLAGRDGDIYWGPDDDPHYRSNEHGWITLKALPEPAVRWGVRVGQAAIVLLAAWAIGWRTLPRDDGRRALHYALVLLSMMLLNQRTWDHHAAVLLPAAVAIWQAVSFGRTSRRVRCWALGLVLAAGACMWLARDEPVRLVGRAIGLDGEALADRLTAYGPTFSYFLLLFLAAVVLAAALRRADAPYAAERQRLGRARAA